MPGSDAFDTRTRELADRVGKGRLQGSVVVDQIYARYQHEGLDLKHPEGGQAKYLEQPLYEDHRDYLQRLADHTLDGTLEGAMSDNMEALSGKVYDLAPLEFGDLKASGHPRVKVSGRIVYDRPPQVHRLTKTELRIKAELRRLGLGNSYD